MLVPELTLRHPDAAATMLTDVFGFTADAGLMRRGTQALRLTEGTPDGHGRIDHIALTVPDLDAALDSMQSAGALLEPDVTPNGPGLVPEFWGQGLRYVYLSGPEGARIELCQRVSGPAAEVGHDHIGIPCRDLVAMVRFFEGQGAQPLARFTITRPDAVTPVTFLTFAGAVVELYQPATPARAALGLWSRLLVQGLAAPVVGPEGLVIAPL
jgi:catechol 2,3-dioxygenase-like lactoylglutathione lyase family enzyme